MPPQNRISRAVRTLEARRTSQADALAALLRQIHEAQAIGRLPRLVRESAQALAEEITAPAPRGWRRLLDRSPAGREAAAVAVLLRAVEADRDQAGLPVRRAAQRLARVLSVSRIPAGAA